MKVMSGEINLLKEMLEIYSPHGKEEAISQFLEKKLKQYGIQAHRDEVGNVLGEVGIGKPILLLCSHMDTVRGKLKVQTKDNIIYGRGACDAKASLAAMMLAMTRWVKKPLERKILFAAVVDEEGASKGMKHLLNKGIEANYVVIGEPSRGSRIVIAYKGSLSLRAVVRGREGHVAASPLYENAIEKAFEFYQLLKVGIEETKESLFYSTNVHLLTIRGGRKGRIPGRCEMLINIRFPPGRKCKEILGEVSNLASRFDKLSVKVVDCTEAYEAKKTSKIALSVFKAITRVRSEPAKFSRKTGTSDMNLMPRDVEAVSFGPGDPTLEHTDEEAIKIDDFLQAVDIYEQTIKELLALEE